MKKLFSTPTGRGLNHFRTRHEVTIKFTIATNKIDSIEVLAHALSGSIQREAVDTHGVGIRMNEVRANGKLQVYSKGGK